MYALHDHAGASLAYCIARATTLYELLNSALGNWCHAPGTALRRMGSSLIHLYAENNIGDWETASRDKSIWSAPMGILCRLTVEEGATPGASGNYERKIRDLAARAELQKTLLEDKRERVERLAQTYP